MSTYLYTEDVWVEMPCSRPGIKSEKSLDRLSDDNIEHPEPAAKEEESSIWEGMMKEYDAKRAEIDEYKKKKNKGTSDYSLPGNSVVEYMEKNILSFLFPAFTNALMQGVMSGALTNSRSTFDLLDTISQNLWNSNPKYPDRASDNLRIHEMPWVIAFLKENPRPFFPKSWTFTPDNAAMTIQACYRGYLVRKREDVQEMRQFWVSLRYENRGSNLDSF